jgi:hypothetical protein
LFPLGLLQTLPKIKKFTDSFLENPSSFRGFQLLGAYKEAVEQYKKSIALHLKALQNLFEENPRLASSKTKTFFLGSGTNLEIVKQDFLLIQENSEVLEKEIKKRENCLWGGECSEDNQGRDPSSRSETPRPKKEPNLLPPTLISPFPEPYKILGPYFTESGCWGFEPDGKPKIETFYIFIKDKKIMPRLATEAYFIDYQAAAERWEGARIFLERGISYVIQSETADYQCPDLTYWPELLGLARKEIGAGEPNKELARRLAEENKLWTLPYFLERVAAFMDFMILNQELEKKSPSLIYILQARTNYSIVFMPFAKSVWRLNQNPQYLEPASAPLGTMYKTYKDLKKMGLADEEIEKFNISQIGVLKEELGEL